APLAIDELQPWTKLEADSIRFLPCHRRSLELESSDSSSAIDELRQLMSWTQSRVGLMKENDLKEAKKGRKRGVMKENDQKGARMGQKRGKTTEPRKISNRGSVQNGTNLWEKNR
ncbi:hypothetical protein PanWU01x14_046630, partial [Parasponia andersonii]